MEIQKLQSFLLDTPIPVYEPSTGFLEIIRKQHHENINSTLYAYFINSEEPCVKGIFLEALLELIEEKCNKKIQMFHAYAYTEVPSEKGRIDILIEDSTSDYKIIIENKLYANLHNDLLDYWNSVSAPEKCKIGILLTLNKHAIPNEVSGKFINIAHFEWINKIQEKFNPKVSDCALKVYLTDFINTVNNLTKSYQMNEQSRFYFTHAEKVNQAIATKYAAEVFLNNQLQLIANKLNWQQHGNSMDWRNFWDENNHLDTYLTIITQNLLNGKMKFMLILELYREDISKSAVLKQHLIEQKFNLTGYKSESRNGQFMHFLTKEYDIEMNDFENFADFVVGKIKEDFANITIAAVKFNYPDKDISHWEGVFRNL